MGRHSVQSRRRGTYTGKMTLASDHLTTAGCVFGGLICKTFEWTRAR